MPTPAGPDHTLRVDTHTDRPKNPLEAREQEQGGDKTDSAHGQGQKAKKARMEMEVEDARTDCVGEGPGTTGDEMQGWQTESGHVGGLDGRQEAKTSKAGAAERYIEEQVLSGHLDRGQLVQDSEGQLWQTFDLTSDSVSPDAPAT